MTAHWSHDPTNDIAWNNYAAGYDNGRDDRQSGTTRDLAGHGQPFIDGYADGYHDHLKGTDPS